MSAPQGRLGYYVPGSIEARMPPGEIVSLWATHVFLPLLFGLWLWRGGHASRGEWSAEASAYGAYLVFVTLTGSWVLIGFVLRYAAPLLFAFVVWRTYRTVRILPWRASDPERRVRVRQIFFASMAAVFLILDLVTLRGYFHPEHAALEMELPFAAGLYGVAHGGSHVILNPHATDAERRFAVELVALGRGRSQATTVLPGQLEDFHIWNRPVLSPGDGVVVAVESRHPDRLGGRLSEDSVRGDGEGMDPTTPAAGPDGNFVRIRLRRTDEPARESADEPAAEPRGSPRAVTAIPAAEVVLGHLRHESLAVAVGDTVVVGELLGRVGCSGSAVVPSLLFYAVSVPGDSRGAASLPMRIEDAFLVRNLQIRGSLAALDEARGPLGLGESEQ